MGEQAFENYPALASWIERLGNTSGLPLGDWMVFLGALNRALEAARSEGQPSPRLEERVSRVMAEGDGFWRPCSGCYESNEGYDTGPRDKVFKVPLGSGCGECGGIGAVWDTTDYAAMGADLATDLDTSAMEWRDISTAPKAETSSEPPICVILEWFNVTEDGGRSFHAGEGYWSPDGGRGEGGWWWANTAAGDYYSDPIEERITGHITRWMPLPVPAGSDLAVTFTASLSGGEGEGEARPEPAMERRGDPSPAQPADALRTGEWEPIARLRPDGRLVVLSRMGWEGSVACQWCNTVEMERDLATWAWTPTHFMRPGSVSSPDPSNTQAQKMGED